ncbi:helix-turn-helix domain-containing protein [Thiotrichales bacterium 19S3-7]|nr:helix-turn-helix domain-containing protein [Thiotrichales bacterium 19S3-7]MCF6803061.1 helix-turn-helix domain-containing protein [Thiotrichales bacterium 19S3-11]
MNVKAAKFLDDLVSEPITFGALIKNIRATEYENMTQQEFAEDVLKISKSRLSDIENNRKPTSIKKAVEIANTLGHSKRYFVLIVMQDMLRNNHLNYKISLDNAAA